MKNVPCIPREYQWIIAAGCLVFLFGTAAIAESQETSSISWKQCLRQSGEWYKSQEALRIAENVLLYQLDTGGWPKNIDMAVLLSDGDKKAIQNQKSKKEESTIDNGATTTQLLFLAKMINAAQQERLQTAFSNGLNFLLGIQYENGGWSQFPYRKGYYSHITFNDNAMIGVMNLLRDICNKEGYAFTGSEIIKQAEKAIRKGIECILKCQVVVDGKRTAWCAQHDETTLLPAPARTYEKISLSGSESVGIVRFLMGIDNPSPAVIDAVQSAVQWFAAVKITGVLQVEKSDPSLPEGRDKIIIADPSAPPLWARFYEIGTNKPIFCGRDGVVKYSLAEIERERRIGYSWYSNSPAGLLEKDYPAWQKKWTPTNNVLD